MRLTKGTNAVDNQLHNWSGDDRQDALDFATNPANGVTAITLYLQQKGLNASMSSVARWLTNIRLESDRVKKMREVFADFKGITPDEINAYCAATMAFVMVTLQQDIEEKTAKGTSLDLRKVQTLANLAKEARSSALAMNTPYSSASMKELELGHLMGFIGKLESIFEGDEAILERVKNACKAILIEVEGQYQN